MTSVRRRFLGFVAAATILTLAWAPTAGAAGKRATPGVPGANVKNYRLDAELTRRASGNPQNRSFVIVELVAGAELPSQYKQFARGGKLEIINGQALELPNGLLQNLAANPSVARVHEDRHTFGHNYRTSITVGARTVQETLGLTGKGIGIAILDSGIASFHDDLTRGSTSTTLYPYGDQRVSKFVDFVNGRSQPYDDNGHGTHIAGTIAGNGYDSRGQKAGIAPDASLVVLKVLNANGQGKISDIIAALDWVAVNGATYNVRVVNMSVGASIKESYWTDPLTLATKALVAKGIVVVTAAGNLGKNSAGQPQYGGITAPGNAPWNLTVGASSTEGSLTRKDDKMAGFSSRGPTFLDWGAKPDLVAPGLGTVSLATPGSTFYSSKSQYLVSGSFNTATMPYLVLSGTSMASPVVAGSVALMIQANPRLTPNLVKAILQYTAETRPGYDKLTEGAGFLNTLGAVRLSRFYNGAKQGDRVPVQRVWSRRLIWGSHSIGGGIMVPSKNAWGLNIIWGTAKTLGDDGDNIIWGTEGDGDNIIWGTDDGDNIIWGTSANGDGDNIIWGTDDGDNIIWGTSFDGDNIIWGTDDGDNIIWGTGCGGADCDDKIWGQDDGDNIIWGTVEEGDNIIWGTSSLDGDNIIWGTSTADGDVTWGSSSSDQEIFPEDDASEPPPDPALEFGDSSATTGGL